MHHMLAGAAAGLQHVAGFAGEEFPQDRPDRRVVAVERRRVEPAIGFNRLAGTGEFGTMFSHSGFSLQVAAIDFLQELQHAQRPRVDDAVIQRLRRAPEFNQPVGAQFCKVL